MPWLDNLPETPPLQPVAVDYEIVWPDDVPQLVVGETLLPYLPLPDVVREADGGFRLEENRPRSIGRLSGFYGNVGVMVRAYAYLLSMGGDGLRQVAERAVLNANYLKSRVQDVFPVSHNRTHMHEFVAKGIVPEAPDVHALDIAKRLIDYGFHPPTNYFPLIVPEALMIEPTETATESIWVVSTKRLASAAEIQ